MNLGIHAALFVERCRSFLFISALLAVPGATALSAGGNMDGRGWAYCSPLGSGRDCPVRTAREAGPTARPSGNRWELARKGEP